MRPLAAFLLGVLITWLVTLLLIVAAVPAQARHRHHHYRHHSGLAVAVRGGHERAPRHHPSRLAPQPLAACPEPSAWMPDPLGWPGLWVKRQGFQSEVELWWQRGGERDW